MVPKSSELPDKPYPSHRSRPSRRTIIIEGAYPDHRSVPTASVGDFCQVSSIPDVVPDPNRPGAQAAVGGAVMGRPCDEPAGEETRGTSVTGLNRPMIMVRCLADLQNRDNHLKCRYFPAFGATSGLRPADLAEIAAVRRHFQSRTCGGSAQCLLIQPQVTAE